MMQENVTAQQGEVDGWPAEGISPARTINLSKHNEEIHTVYA